MSAIIRKKRNIWELSNLFNQNFINLIKLYLALMMPTLSIRKVKETLKVR